MIPREGHRGSVNYLFCIYSPNIVRVIKSRILGWDGHVARMEEGRAIFKFVTGKPIEKRSLRRPKRR